MLYISIYVRLQILCSFFLPISQDQQFYCFSNDQEQQTACSAKNATKKPWQLASDSETSTELIWLKIELFDEKNRFGIIRSAISKILSSEKNFRKF